MVSPLLNAQSPPDYIRRLAVATDFIHPSISIMMSKGAFEDFPPPKSHFEITAKLKKKNKPSRVNTFDCVETKSRADARSGRLWAMASPFQYLVPCPNFHVGDTGEAYEQVVLEHQLSRSSKSKNPTKCVAHSLIKFCSRTWAKLLLDNHLYYLQGRTLCPSTMP